MGPLGKYSKLSIQTSERMFILLTRDFTAHILYVQVGVQAVYIVYTL